jgi:hypothetical protein
VILTALIALRPSLAHPLALPDYRVEAPKVHLRKCDSDTTSIMMYRTATYYVTEATAHSGDIFIMHYAGSGGARFVKKSAASSEPTELTRDQWFQQIEKAAPNYFRHVRGMPGSDCYVAETYY